MKLPTQSRQAGTALIMSLGLLAILSLIGFTSMQTSSLEEKLTGNVRSRSFAFSSAETALEVGADWVRDQANVQLNEFNELFQCPDSGTVQLGYYRADSVKCSGGQPAWQEIEQNQEWETKGLEVKTGMKALSSQPRYIIEGSDLRSFNLEAGTPHMRTFVYRITARGVGNTEKAIVMLQATAQTN
jgi:type IV pilus assembly protein PilX